MVVSIISQNIKIVMDAYILGTMFHYIVKRDPEQEVTKQLMRSLDVYCHGRQLPGELHEKIKDYFEFQQKHSSSTSDNVLQVGTRIKSGCTRQESKLSFFLISRCRHCQIHGMLLYGKLAGPMLLYHASCKHLALLTVF
jgi:hypothetical protein